MTPAQLKAENAKLREHLALLSDSAGVKVLLRECRDVISLAHRAVECGATPGPAWQARAAEVPAEVLPAGPQPRRRGSALAFMLLAGALIGAGS